MPKNKVSRSKPNPVSEKSVQSQQFEIQTPTWRIKEEFDQDLNVSSSLEQGSVDRDDDYGVKQISRGNNKKSKFAFALRADDKFASRWSRSGRTLKIPLKYLEQTSYEVNSLR